MSSLFGGSAPKPPPPTAPIKQAPQKGATSADDRRKRAQLLASQRAPSRFGALGLPGTGAAGGQPGSSLLGQ